MRYTEPIIVTAWGGFMDIDAFACTVAYAELLRHAGYESQAEFSDPLNASVTPALRACTADFSTTRTDGESYVIVDMSDPHVIERFAPLDRIVEIYDHHFGFETYWQERLGENAKIERIGAAATLIWEEFIERKYAEKISQPSAILLAHAIISNTVNFCSDMTTERDRKALMQLEEYWKLEKDWIMRYFKDQQAFVEANPDESIRNDTKYISLPIYESVAFGQIETWDARAFIRNISLEEIFARQGVSTWVFNCVDISQKSTVVRSNDSGILQAFAQTFGGTLGEGNASFDSIILRKEFLPILRKYAGLKS